MDCYSIVKDFAGPIATVIAASVAVYVTWRLGSGQTKIAQQQAETARRGAQTAKDQLRLNLFDKRYAVYKGIERRLKILLDSKSETTGLQITSLQLIALNKPETALEVAQLFVAFDEAAFFFSPATCEWLQTVRNDCQAFLEANAKGTDNFEIKINLLEHFGAMPERFRDDLSFSQPTSD